MMYTPDRTARSSSQGQHRGDSKLSQLVVPGSALLLFAACVGFGSPPGAAQRQPAKTAIPPAIQAFLHQNCFACHNTATASGGLNLTVVSFVPTEPGSFAFWARAYDRVASGEMPPKSAKQAAPASRQVFLLALKKLLVAADDVRVRRDGRAVSRRMNRLEYENTLRDLLDAPWLQIKDMLPEDGLANRLNKVGTALDVSHVQMSRYLAAADYALREAIAPQPTRPETTVRRLYAREQRSFAGLARREVYEGEQERLVFPIIDNAADVPALTHTGPMTVGLQDPARREREAMGVVASSYEPMQPRFDRFRAPVAGHYKLRLCAHSFWAGPNNEKRWWHPSLTSVSAGRTNEPISLYALLPPQQLRKLGDVNIGPAPTVGELDVDLLKGESIVPDAARFFRSRPPAWHNPLATKEGQPGVAFQWLEIQGPIFTSWPTQGHQLMFADLPIKATSHGVEAIPNDPNADAARLIRGFVQRSYRRPAVEADIQPFVKLYHAARDTGAGFTDALIAAYTGVLCSPAFVTLQEAPGRLDDYSIASRLSYFLWNSEPDAALRELADQHELHDSKVLHAQTDRMLGDPRSSRFINAFLDYWLDLRKTSDTSPDETLYPDYYLDDLLTQSSVDETRAFFSELVKRDLPVRNLVSSDFVMINERLAELYGLQGVQGASIRRVELPKESVRGGLLTQASVLKVTANGTTTSPVLRGVWIDERILGQSVPPPPPSVPAIEPDIRGATTIREQLTKHRTQQTCRACHAKIDPPGFALESFDVFGGWRDRYRSLGVGEHAPGFGKNGQPFTFHAAGTVDPSGVLPDGRPFSDVRDLKRLLVQDERQIARNLVNQLVTYSTGAPIQFGDRPKVDTILDRTKPDGYGVKSLIYGIIDSELFRNK